MQVGYFDRVQHRSTWRTSGVAHVAVPVLSGATNTDRAGVLGDIGHDDDLRTTRDAPTLAENVELDFAETAREVDLLRRGDVLAAKEENPVLVIGTLDDGEIRVAERP